MAQTGLLTKALALGGTVLAWLPLIATLAFSALGSLRAGSFRFDYLLPAEFFPVALAGAALLLWGSLRARARRRLIGGGLAAMLILLIGGQALAVATGLASGAIEPAGWPWALVMASLAGYTLALGVTACAGVLLVRDLYRGGRGRVRV